jgi:hypothetical protein
VRTSLGHVAAEQLGEVVLADDPDGATFSSHLCWPTQHGMLGVGRQAIEIQWVIDEQAGRVTVLAKVPRLSATSRAASERDQVDATRTCDELAPQPRWRSRWRPDTERRSRT